MHLLMLIACHSIPYIPLVIVACKWTSALTCSYMCILTCITHWHAHTHTHTPRMHTRAHAYIYTHTPHTSYIITYTHRVFTQLFFSKLEIKPPPEVNSFDKTENRTAWLKHKPIVDINKTFRFHATIVRQCEHLCSVVHNITVLSKWLNPSISITKDQQEERSMP